MHQLLILTVFWLLPMVFMLDKDSPLDCIPRKTVPYHSENAHLFHEEGVFNYSTMLLNEDLGLLVLGAREALYALDLNDISKKLASVKWEVTRNQQDACQGKGKNPETECKNYIRILQKLKDNRMYVCGTNAFDPECDHMSFEDGKLILEKKPEDGKGKCPFDPFQRYASLMVDNDLYSATSVNFLGSEPVVMRSSPVSVRTEFKSTWLFEPNFVSMALMEESKHSNRGDDDKVYIFFSETAVEYDCFDKSVVSRVARVCKGDIGGLRTLQKKWTSFLKARIDCPVLHSQLPHVIQDVYRWCGPQQRWKDCLFFAIFTPQSDTSDLSAVCSYRASDISTVFREGNYKTPVHVETSFVKWVMYSGEVPVPRPGACIDNEAREAGISQTSDLPDQTLQFIRDKPLMDQTIQPIGGKADLVWRGARFTRIIADQVEAADGRKYRVMFIGTEEGTLLKAVNYDGEMFIIEEVQLFEHPDPVKILQFSNRTRHIYAGSNHGAVQIPLSTCGRSLSCVDCVLARDPYCGWDTQTEKCAALSDAQSQLIQSVLHGDASLCPDSDNVKFVNQSIWQGSRHKLHCPNPSNLAKPIWQRDTVPVVNSAHLQLLPDGLLILNASDSDGGLYRCLSVEHSRANEYTTAVVEYQVSIIPVDTRSRNHITSPEPQTGGPSVSGLQAAVAVLVILLAALLGWNLYKGHLPLSCRRKKQEQPQLSSSATHQHTEQKPLTPGRADSSTKNNYTSSEAESNNDEQHNDSVKVILKSLQSVDEESEI
ncbi:semaphorin-4E [Thalassophryne amazonica]|uniref:semaphorin-4E n=1 Tax=Thalassophryne amazonica TaxID=390379 RepID=UPI001471791C|nr:semaphorin-4E [Thalassophryne amazonica]